VSLEREVAERDYNTGRAKASVCLSLSFPPYISSPRLWLFSVAYIDEASCHVVSYYMEKTHGEEKKEWPFHNWHQKTEPCQ
jgi:hypothetical protein